ncbi:RHS repeat-associated core domain-containing protein [Archangium violaceum]|uniref:RHS repeat-associated core domain-containing protein n=1 Tax=Archangium violaceum TaxID=83451 RepID=UPI0037C0DD5E
MSVKMRALFHLLDMRVGTVELVDEAAGSVLTSESGTGRARFWSQWVQPSTGSARVRVVWPGGVGGAPSTGVVLEAYEYQRYQTGAQPFWTPLRFPGQYYDAETDLFENWNRYYDPTIGRYLQSEPLLSEVASSLPAYSYALNNPMIMGDLDGLAPWRIAHRVVGAGIRAGERITRKVAKRIYRAGGAVVSGSARASKKLAKDVSKEAGGGGKACHVEAHGNGANHYHSLDKRGRHLEGAGHVFYDEDLVMIPTLLFDPNENGEWMDNEDLFEWFNPFPFGSYEDFISSEYYGT